MQNKSVEEIMALIRETASRCLPPGSRLALFGSRARGDAHEGSDWDIHILIPGEKDINPFDAGEYAFPIEELGWSLNQDFSVLVYTYSQWAKRSFLPFYKNVEKEKIIFFQN